MAALTDTNISSTYVSLFKSSDNGDLTGNTEGSVVNLTDGIGTSSALYIGRDRIGIGEDIPNVKLEITDTSTQLELSYNDSNKTAFYTHSDGSLLVTPSGDRVKLAKDLTLLTNVIENSDNQDCITLTADRNVVINGKLQLLGMEILAPDGDTTITLDNADNVIIGNYLTVGGNRINAADGDACITMDNSSNVTIAGDLTISGGNITNAITIDGILTLGSTFVTTDHIDINADNKNLRIGAGDDLEIYHDGSDSHIKNNTGVLKIGSNSGMSGGSVEIGHQLNCDVLMNNLTTSGKLHVLSAQEADHTASAGARGSIEASGGLYVHRDISLIGNILGSAAGSGFIIKTSTGGVNNMTLVDSGDIYFGNDLILGNDKQIKSSGSMIFMLDWDGNEGSKRFAWRNNGTGDDLMTLSEDGILTVAGGNPMVGATYQSVQVYGADSTRFNASTGYALWIGQTPGSINNAPYNAHSHTSTQRMTDQGMQWVWPSNGTLQYLYFIVDDQNPNGASATWEFKVYRYRPNGSTNTGDVFYDASGGSGLFSDYTLLETVTRSNAQLAAKRRGIYVPFDTSDCVFNAGDVMGITFGQSADSGAGDNPLVALQGHILLQHDWSNLVTGNI